MSKKIKKILVTGSRGVIGSKLVEILRTKGYDVFGCDLFHTSEIYGHGLGKLNGKENYFRCDISEYRQLEYVVDYVRPDFVFNLAAEFGRWNSTYFYEQVWKTNCIGVENILKLQQKYKFKLIHASSSEVYGDIELKMTEDLLDKLAIEQLNSYAMTKRCNEQQIKNSNLLYGTNSVIIRFFNTYSNGEWYHPFRSVNCVFVYNLLHGRPITVFKGHTRTSTYIDDAVESVSNIVEVFKDGEIYNIASTTHHSIEDLANIILKHTKANPNLVSFVDKNEVMTTKHKIVDNSKAVKDLNFKETVSLDEGVRRTIEWMKKYYNV